MRHAQSFSVAVLLGLTWTAGARAGLYYSGEVIADLPSQWRGFLLDQRTLRTIAVKPTGSLPASPERVKYETALQKLETAAKGRELTADERADQGALLVRLGEPARAVEVLRAAQRRHPQHFRITANLGTAYQLTGELGQAAATFQEAVRLAPGKFQEAEKAQLRLVRLRQREPRGAQDLDDLFGVRYVGEGGKYEPGRLAAAERKKLAADTVAVAQQLALWLPADGRLLWQLAELAAVHGDVRTAAAIMDGCVTQFNMGSPELRRHRQAARAAADELAGKADAADLARAAHEGHAPGLKPRSSRPLVGRLDTSSLPAVSATGVNALPWAVLSATTVDRHFKPAFPPYLRELDGKQVSLSGFMQPLGPGREVTRFLLIEYPVGCWYCEMPEITGIILVELPRDKTASFSRGHVKVEGRLTLNATDPENFLFTLGRARVAPAD
jgi:tetratricopeptide (TPR) repeat protein